MDVAEAVERIAYFAASSLDEAVDVNVTDAGTDEKGEVDGGTRNLITDEIKDQGTRGAFAANGDRNVSAARSFEKGGDAGRIHAFRGFAVDGENLVARPDTGFIGRGSFKGIEDDDLGLAIAGGLRLDGHADAVVLAVLLLTHLRVGFRVVEVGVRVKDMEHAGDGPVVNRLVGLVGVQRLGVVLFDERVDIREGMEGISEGGLVAGGLSSDLLIDQRAEDGAGGEK